MQQENIKGLQPIKEEKFVGLKRVSACIDRERELLLDLEKLVCKIRDRLGLGCMIIEPTQKDIADDRTTLADDRTTLDIFADRIDENKDLLVKINDLLVDIDYRI